MSAPILPIRRGVAPVVLVKPIGRHFLATVLRRRDGSEHRLQVFADPAGAARNARLLNAAIAEGRS